jgi:hypothetical protein
MPRLNSIPSARASLPLSASQHRVQVTCQGGQRNSAGPRCVIQAPSHQILAMRTHLVTLDDRCMGPASARYMIRINGHLGATLLSAFPVMASERQGPETVLTGVLDQPGLYGVLAEIEALGLDLLEVRQLAPEARSPERGDTCSP